MALHTAVVRGPPTHYTPAGIAVPADYDGEIAGKLPPGWEPRFWRFIDGKMVDHPQERLAAAWADLKAERDKRLAATDWTQMRDQPEKVAKKWEPYRQALRDMPATTADPLNPAWPLPPG